MNRPEVKMVRVHRREEAEAVDLARFAQSFGHQPPQVFPVDLIYVGEKLVGYFTIQEQAVIYPALHPSTLTPRETWSVFHHVTKAYKRRYGNPMVFFDKEYEKGGPTVEKMAKLGLRPLDAQFYDLEDYHE